MTRPRYSVLRRATLLTISAFALILPSAQAAPFTPALEEDFQFAADWWGTTPTGCSSIDRQVVPGALIEASGRATQPLPGAPAVPCVIQISKEIEVRCQQREVVLHEYGHLLGYGHSPNPLEIMHGSSLPGLLCADWKVDLFRKGLRDQLDRCHPKSAPAQIRWCRYQERGWRRMIAEAAREREAIAP